MFMNSNSLPIALVQSLVATVQGLKWGQDDHKNAMFGRALTYLVVFSTLGMMVSACPFPDILGHPACHRKESLRKGFYGRPIWRAVRVSILSRVRAPSSTPVPVTPSPFIHRTC